MTLPDGGRTDHHDPYAADSTTLHLVERVRHGNQEALADLMQRFLPRLRRWASGRLPGAVRDLADTSDLVQDVLLRWFQKIKGLEFDRDGGAPVSTYVRRSSIAFVTSSARRAGGPRPSNWSPLRRIAGASPLEAAIGRQALEKYKAALAALRPVDREAIIARTGVGIHL